MEIFKSIINFLKTKDSNPEIIAPEGICPNCWGRQEYAGHFYDALKQENINANSIESNTGWINAYATKHLQGIVLERTGNGEEVICKGCKVSYQHTDKHTAE